MIFGFLPQLCCCRNFIRDGSRDGEELFNELCLYMQTLYLIVRVVLKYTVAMRKLTVHRKIITNQILNLQNDKFAKSVVYHERLLYSLPHQTKLPKYNTYKRHTKFYLNSFCTNKVYIEVYLDCFAFMLNYEIIVTRDSSCVKCVSLSFELLS